MSAVCGVVGLDGRPYRRDDLAGMLAALRPLGPDGGDSWAGQAGRTGVAVGAVLRRRVPADGWDRQPLERPADGPVLVADVVLDNRSELADRLGMPDRPDLPDAELVLAAYERWGTDCPRRLVGDFAFAVVDRRRGGVFLARDHLGTRPLHVHTQPGRLGFATTALALTGLAGVGHDLDLHRAVEMLAIALASQRSWVAGVRPLPPATALWADPAGIRTWRYWQLEPDRRDTERPPEEQVEALRAAFDTAVGARLRRTGAVGVSLSGGLDSTSVAATAAARLDPEPVYTYTSVPPPGWAGRSHGTTEPDERYLVEDLAAAYGNLRPTYVDVRGTSFFDEYDEVFAAGGTPPRNPCNLTWIFATHRRAAADGVSTWLTGSAGNLYFSPDDPRWLVDLLRAGRPRMAGRELRAYAAASGSTGWRVVRSAVLRELAPAAVRRGYNRLHGRDAIADWWASTALRPELRASSGDPAGAGVDATLREIASDSLLGRAAQAEFIVAEEARHGFREADPTADVRLIELSARQPAWVRRRDGLTRAACRLAMAGRLPDSIRLRTVRGAQLPDWLDRMTDARAELCTELAAIREHPLAREVIDVERLERAIDHWPAPDTVSSMSLVQDYRLAVLRGLLIGRYIRWFTDTGKAGRQTRNADADRTGSVASQL